MNHQSAASKLRRVKKAVEANLWKEEPLLPVHKINCAKLLEFYAKSKNKKAGDTRRYTRQIIEWELKYIGSCEQSEKFVEETFSGSLPAFLAAFTTRKKLSEEEIAELQTLIDQSRR